MVAPHWHMLFTTTRAPFRGSILFHVDSLHACYGGEAVQLHIGDFARADASSWQCLSLLLQQLACKYILDTACKFNNRAQTSHKREDCLGLHLCDWAKIPCARVGWQRNTAPYTLRRAKMLRAHLTPHSQDACSAPHSPHAQNLHNSRPAMNF